jgi:hypothetical protein
MPRIELSHLAPAILLLSLLRPAFAAQAANCSAEYERMLAASLAMTYDEFDQTPGKGFRELAERGCAKEAADLIEAYIAANEAKQASLTWHIAQLRAEQGDYATAIAKARQTLREHEDFSDNPLRWNDYVLATIAFLEHDAEGLEAHRDKVADGASAYWGNELNLKLLDNLIRHFDRPYAEATSDNQSRRPFSVAVPRRQAGDPQMTLPND